MSPERVPLLTENIREGFGGDPTGEQTRLVFQRVFCPPHMLLRELLIRCLTDCQKITRQDKSSRSDSNIFKKLANLEGPGAYLFYNVGINLYPKLPELEIAALWEHPLIHPLSSVDQEQQALLIQAYATYVDKLDSIFFGDGLEIVSSSDFVSVNDFKDNFIPSLNHPIKPIITLTVDELRNGSEEDNMQTLTSNNESLDKAMPSLLDRLKVPVLTVFISLLLLFLFTKVLPILLV